MTSPRQRRLLRETRVILERCKKSAILYRLHPGETLKDITQLVFKHSNTSAFVKNAIQEQNRTYFAFSYPSDNLKVKGYLSLPQQTAEPLPLLILLRGGYRYFSLPHPSELSAQPGYALISTTYRDGVSEGQDEFGGNDVNDVKNLMVYLPELEKQLGVTFHHKNKYMIGTSRGGMQLFLSLGRYPEIQHQIKKVASISGHLHLKLALHDREDFKYALVHSFGYTMDERGQAWLAYREPINTIPQLSQDLPILIAQGTDDIRILLKEGYDMVEALRAQKHKVTYFEIEGGDHGLLNGPGFIAALMKWLEEDS